MVDSTDQEFSLHCSINYRKRNAEISTIVDYSISHFCSINFCFKNFEALLLSEHVLRILISSWRICLFVKGLFSSFSLVIFLLKNTSFYINMSMPAFLLVIGCMVYIFYSFTLNLTMTLYQSEFLVDSIYLSLAF